MHRTEENALQLSSLQRNTESLARLPIPLQRGEETIRKVRFTAVVPKVAVRIKDD